MPFSIMFDGRANACKVVTDDGKFASVPMRELRFYMGNNLEEVDLTDPAVKQALTDLTDPVTRKENQNKRKAWRKARRQKRSPSQAHEIEALKQKVRELGGTV